MYGRTLSGTRIIGTVGIQPLTDSSMKQKRQTTFTDELDSQYSEIEMFLVYSRVKKYFCRRTGREPSALQRLQPGVQAGNLTGRGIFVDNALTDPTHDCRLGLF